MALFPDSLLSEIQSRGEPVKGSFLVSILVRDEPQIRLFRDAMETWYHHVPTESRGPLTARLCSVDNDEFFQGFAELAIHQLLRREGLEILEYPDGDEKEFFRVRSPEESREFYLSVVSFIPEDHPHHVQRIYQNFLDELNRIEHRYRFAVYLRRWLPPEFEAGVVRRALESWFRRLDSDPHGGQYAEYRDGGVHVEFSILSRLEKPSTNLVGFNLTPLDSTEIIDRFGEVVEREQAKYEALKDDSRPLVIVLFNNDEWKLGPNYLYSFLYGKPRRVFTWKTLGGRREIVLDFSPVYARSVFNAPRGQSLAAVVVAEKLWQETGVDLRIRCLHNPWCTLQLPKGFFAEHASLKPIEGASEEDITVYWKHLDSQIVHLT